MHHKSNDRNFFFNILGIVLIVYGLSMLPPLTVAFYCGETTATLPLGAGMVLSLISGYLMRHFTDLDSDRVRAKMNYKTTILVWLIIIGLTTIIYYLGRAEFTWIDSFFEATASLTTTGMGNLDVNVFPYSFQLWRSILNWFGGVGIILIAVSCISDAQFSGHSLISVEVPGPEFLKSSVAFRSTYRHMILIYLSLTAIHFVLLVIAGMDPFTSVLTALSNISTAGMQHISNGVITSLSLPLKVIITIFAFLGSLNVSFFILLIMQKNRMILRRTEVSLYTGRMLVTALFIGAVIAVFDGRNFFRSFGEALMQTVSFLSTSGYIVTDCSSWPFICEFFIILQMFFGACAVSTGGGIKIARIEIAFKTARFGLFRHIHPRAVRPVKFNNETIKPEQFVSANLFISVFLFIYIAGALFLSIDNKSESIFDALNYSQAMLTNTGTSIAELDAPGLAMHFSPLSKVVMSFEMLAGRLEIYPVLMLFTRSFWSSKDSY